MIAYYEGCEGREERKRGCACDCGVTYVDRRIEVMPDLSRMSRHDRRTVEAIARKYGIQLRRSQECVDINHPGSRWRPHAR